MSNSIILNKFEIFHNYLKKKKIQVFFESKKSDNYYYFFILCLKLKV